MYMLKHFKTVIAFMLSIVMTFLAPAQALAASSSADLNADEGKQWLAIYVSKNSMAGKPIMPDFKITEIASAPRGMDGNIHTLGEKGAENLCNAD